MKVDSLPTITLKPGREKSVIRHHPWIFSGAIDRTDPGLEAGDSVGIRSSSGAFLGIGAFSPKSQIRCRIWEFTDNKSGEWDLQTLLLRRIEQAHLNRKNDKNLKYTDSFRLVHGESDLLPGLIVDIYKDVAVIQFLSSGVDLYREEIVQAVAQVANVSTIYERSDAEVRALEGLPELEGLLYGEIKTKPTVIVENDLKYQIDYTSGHKTGFYLDQRDNRNQIRQYSSNKRVLDCFSYSGGFSINSLVGGASSITAIDDSGEAISSLHENLRLNNFSVDAVECIQNDAFKQLRLFRDEAAQFDLIVLDPPKFAPTRKQIPNAARGYKDINLLALKLLSSNGVLFTFSCSGGVDMALFHKIVAGAALDAGVDIQVIGKMFQASDHPVLSTFPEGEYLKGLICRKIKK